MSGLLLWNRLIWLAVGVAIFAFAYSRFRFEERAGRKKKTNEIDEADGRGRPRSRVSCARRSGSARNGRSSGESSRWSSSGW